MKMIFLMTVSESDNLSDVVARYVCTQIGIVERYIPCRYTLIICPVLIIIFLANKLHSLLYETSSRSELSCVLIISRARIVYVFQSQCHNCVHSCDIQLYKLV